MAKISLKLTKEHIILIKNLNIQKLNDYIFGIDTYNLYGGTFKFEQMALLLGYQDKILPQTAESIWGPRYEEEVQKHLEDLDGFFIDNLGNIEEILHQFCATGIKEGTYECKDNIHLWSFKE